MEITPAIFWVLIVPQLELRFDCIFIFVGNSSLIALLNLSLTVISDTDVFGTEVLSSKAQTVM